MPIPDFQTIMLPLLKATDDRLNHRFREIRDQLAEYFALTEEERSEMLQSGVQTRFDNRVRWARTHLGKAGLLEAPARGIFRITSLGQEVLAREPTRITMRTLDEFPSYAAWRGRDQESRIDENDGARTPQEEIDAHYRSLRRDLEESLLTRIQHASPAFFERLVVRLLVAMGYGGSQREAAGAVRGRPGDEGIDGLINEDPLGLETIYIQAKRWDQNVGRPQIQQFSGSLDGQRARKGVFITTSSFSAEARDFVGAIDKKIVLIDGTQLANLMVEHGVGVRRVEQYVLNDVDEDFFAEEIGVPEPNHGELT